MLTDTEADTEVWEDVDGPSTSAAEPPSSTDAAWPAFDPATVDLAIAGQILDAIAVKEREVRRALRARRSGGGAALPGALAPLRDLRYQALRARWEAGRGGGRGGARQRDGAERGSAPVSAAAAVPAPAAIPPLKLRDPAAPKPGAHILSAEPLAAASPARPAPGRERASALPESLRRRLAAEAPELPAGAYTHFWDSGQQRALTSGTAEVYNHWGAVDVSKGDAERA